MTATDELRRLLDERGVEYTVNDGKHVKETCWPYMGELMAYFVEFDNGATRFELDHWCFTPDQAIAATLGVGECEFVGNVKYPPKCSACGWQAGIYDCEWLEDGEYEYDGKFCKECGAKVKR